MSLSSWTRRSLWLGLALLLLGPSAAHAQSFYATGHFGGSYATLDVSGNNEFSRSRIRGDDVEQSIVGGGGAGFGFNLDWVLPPGFTVPRPEWVGDDGELVADWIGDWITRWNVRTDFEASAARSFDFEASSGRQFLPFQGDAESISLIQSLWLDVPVYGGFSAHLGVGAGVALNDISLNDSFTRGSKEKPVFAWQWGAGGDYAFDERVTLGLGYRSIHLGGTTVKLRNGGRDAGEADVDLHAHEFLMRVRVKFYSFKFRPFDPY